MTATSAALKAQATQEALTLGPTPGAPLDRHVMTVEQHSEAIAPVVIGTDAS